MFTSTLLAGVLGTDVCDAVGLLRGLWVLNTAVPTVYTPASGTRTAEKTGGSFTGAAN